MKALGIRFRSEQNSEKLPVVDRCDILSIDEFIGFRLFILRTLSW